MGKTFEDYYIEYVDYLKLKLKPQSFVSVMGRFKNYIIPFFAKKEMESITPYDYLQWQKMIEKQEVSYSYKKTLHYSVVAFYEYLIVFHGFKQNVAKQVGNFRCHEIKKEMEFYTFEEFKKFESSFEEKDIIYKYLFHFLFFTGARIGEVLALHIGDLKDDMIFIGKTISKSNFNGKKLEYSPKTASGIRYIRLDNSCISITKELKKIYNKEYGYIDNQMYLFGGIKGLSITSIERRKAKYCKISNLREIRIHDFRHSNATLLIQKGVPIIEVSRRLGHSDINTTINTYSHLSFEYEKRAVETLNSLSKI